MTGRRRFLKMMAVAGLAFLLPGCQSGPLPIGTTPPEAHLVDLSGRRVSLPADFSGKVLVIHFWTSHCPACAIEMATLESIHRSHSDQDVAFCSVNVGDSRGPAERYLKGIDISYAVLLDEESATRRAYRISGVPTVYVLDRKNTVRFVALGTVQKAELEKIITALLQQSENSGLNQRIR